MKNALNGFKDFISRGNAVDLAVGVVIGTAFSAVTKALVDNLITPLIAALFGQPNLDKVMAFTINKAQFSVGAVLTALLNFLLVAAAIYFLVVLPLNALAARRARGEEPEAPAAKADDIALLEEIRDLLAAQKPQS